MSGLPYLAMRSQMPDSVWPPQVTGESATILALMRELDALQWQTVETLAQGQFQQLPLVAAHAVRHSPLTAERFAAAGLRPEELTTPEAMRRLPPLDRRTIITRQDDLYCRVVPPSHGAALPTQTSGSTGEPVTVRRTALNNYFWLAYTMREHGWYGRDFAGRLAVIRANTPPAQYADWGQPVNLFYASGPQFTMMLNRDIAEQGEWLRAADPDYLLTNASNLGALLDWFEAKAVRLPKLRQIRTVTETLPERTRRRAETVLGVSIVDNYSSQEVGVIAMQCPESGLYHTSENLIVEIVGEAGEPCAPGGIGRVIVTDLHNFATPLLRYAIGDYAEVGPPCACGRGLPTLKRILGRERNMLRIIGKDGRPGVRWPMLGFMRYREIAPVLQFQLIQTAMDRIEVRLVVAAPVTPAQQQQLAKVINDALGSPFKLDFAYFEGRLPLNANGKFEEFVCKVPA